jgi:trimethylamine--corrinoid protein Co-methyltransferase
MVDRMQTLTPKELGRIHDASMDILSRVGAAFHEPDALALFRHHGFKVEGNVVFFREPQVRAGLEQAPSRFEVVARDPAKSVWIGGEDFVFAPTYGPPFMIGRNGERRPGKMSDYDMVCKLVQTSAHIDMNGYKHVEPQDVPGGTAYLDMLFSNIILCDKPFMGSADSRQAAQDTIEMAGIVFGGKESLPDKAVMVSLINVLSPLQYTAEMAGAILEYARYRQPLVIANMLMAGTSGPVKLASLLALMNAEILAGMVLSQLAGPGTPVVYGTTSCPTNLRSGAAMVGTAETAIIASMAAQLANFYKLPCRAGGSLTDALVPDAQAMAEGALILCTTVRSGVHFILHSCGMMGTYIGNSLEKWLMDEELCAMARRMLTPVEISAESTAVESIAKVGIGGNYLLQPETFKECRTAFYDFSLFCKLDDGSPPESERRHLTEAAGDMLIKRLGAYEKPPIDPLVEAALTEFILRKKNEETKD